MIHPANKQGDGYYYQCRTDYNPSKLQQCQECRNWFCKNCISYADNKDASLFDPQEILLCDQDQGKPSLL